MDDVCELSSADIVTGSDDERRASRRRRRRGTIGVIQKPRLGRRRRRAQPTKRVPKRRKMYVIQECHKLAGVGEHFVHRFGVFDVCSDERGTRAIRCVSAAAASSATGARTAAGIVRHIVCIGRPRVRWRSTRDAFARLEVACTFCKKCVTWRRRKPIDYLSIAPVSLRRMRANTTEYYR